MKGLRTSMLKTLEKFHERLNEINIVLNVVKTELIVFGEENKFEKFTYREETIHAKENSRYLGVLKDKNPTLSVELINCLSKLAVAIRSIYCV